MIKPVYPLKYSNQRQIKLTVVIHKDEICRFAGNH